MEHNHNNGTHCRERVTWYPRNSQSVKDHTFFSISHTTRVKKGEKIIVIWQPTSQTATACKPIHSLSISPKIYPKISDVFLCFWRKKLISLVLKVWHILPAYQVTRSIHSWFPLMTKMKTQSLIATLVFLLTTSILSLLLMGCWLQGK